MKKYRSIFRIKFIAGLQYRSAAIAGIITQFIWGIMELLLFRAFYETDSGAFPMSFEALVSYVWLQQALLTLFMTWIMENDIFQTITDGGIAYELCRPIELYDMWFVRSLANRLSKAVLRCLPILAAASLFPKPYRMRLPADMNAAVWFLPSIILCLLIVVAFGMIIYIMTLFTVASFGLRIIIIGLVDFLSGNVVPLPFFPDKIRGIVELLPFASMQNTALRIYSGDISGAELYRSVGLQLFWLTIMIFLGKRLIKAALKRVVLQGG